ncbi:MAG: TolC family protein [Dysgonamonadaceae bacterium]|jgi:cobalt-zinc-cadmium efflux system outer membrane protein|nr:TolC family protein [Dysgonamonadaceae bacterium]
MNKYLTVCFLMWNLSSGFAQEQAVKLSPGEIEALFLKQNLLLLAEHMNIDKADAAVLQAKLWDNPNVSIGDVNFWHPGNEKQFSLEISQLIQTANKRAKRISLEKSAKAIALAEFENLLLELKKELRQTLNEIVYLQLFRKALDSQEKSLSRLIEASQKQLTEGNMSKTELLRLQSSLLELMSEMNENFVAFQERQKILKSLLNIEYEAIIEIKNNNHLPLPETLSLVALQETALENRPDIRSRQMQVQYYEKSLAYEKSLKVSDITLSANYDYSGGVWNHFAGIGLSFDLPFFNRNQGNVKAAQADIRQKGYLLQQQRNIVRNEVAEVFENYSRASQFYRKISADDLSGELDSMLEIYSRKLLNKDIGLLEYIDFMNTYKSNKQILFSAQKQMNMLFEQLQFVVGKDIE